MENRDLELDGIDGGPEVPPAKYQVQLTGYDADMEVTGYYKVVYESGDPEPAMAFAKSYADKLYATDDIDKTKLPKDVKFVEVSVETVVDLEGDEVNVGTLFDECGKLR